MKLIIPCNVCIHRYYRAYVEVEENATDEQIRNMVENNIVVHQDTVLCEDPDIEIEKEDIEWIQIDHEAEWTEQEEEEIKEILLRKK